MEILKPKIAIVEDNDSFREMVVDYLAESDLYDVSGAFSTGLEVIEHAIRQNPDIILVDLSLPDMSGIDVIKKVIGAGCPSDCIVLTGYDDDEHLFPALEAGAVGYVVKGVSKLSDIGDVIEDYINGGAPMSPSIARRVIEKFLSDGRQTPPRKSDLTQRELQVLDLLSEGFSIKAVSKEIDVSYETVRAHLRNVYQKLHVHSLDEAIDSYRNIIA